MNSRKNENSCLLFILTRWLNCGKENHDFRSICSFQKKKILSNLTFTLIYSLTKWLKDDVKDSCSENFVMFAEKFPQKILLKEVTLRRVCFFCFCFFFFFVFWTQCSAKHDFFEIYEIFNVTNNTNGRLNLTKEGIINFEYCYFDSYSFFCRFEVVVAVDKNVRLYISCIYVLTRCSRQKY